MKTTRHYKGHRWTNEELTELMKAWQDNQPLEEIAARLNVTNFSVSKMIVKLRGQGIPLQRRTKGHRSGRHNKPWTQAEVEYLIRRRHEKATVESIACDLGRSFMAVQGMIQKLRQNFVEVPMYGQGVRKLWDANALRAAFLNKETEETIQ